MELFTFTELKASVKKSAYNLFVAYLAQELEISTDEVIRRKHLSIEDDLSVKTIAQSRGIFFNSNGDLYSVMPIVEPRFYNSSPY